MFALTLAPPEKKTTSCACLHRDIRRNMSKDYYEILGLSRAASSEEIRKAYRRLALTYHPDKNPTNRIEAEERFKEISKAYQTLSDPEKRRIYDAQGSASVGAAPRHGHSSAFFFSDPFFKFPRRDHDLDDAFTLFERMFGGRDSFAGFFDDGGTGNSVFSSAGGAVGSFSMSSATSTTTTTVNGRTVTRTERTIRHPDGRVESQVTEEVRDAKNGQVLSRKGINNGHSHKSIR